MSIKKTQKLIDLAKKGGNNADLYILQLIDELENKLEKMDEKMPDLGMFLANVRGEDGVSIEEISIEDGILTIVNSEGEEFSAKVDGENGKDAEVTEELKNEIAELVKNIIEFPDYSQKFSAIENKIKEVEEKKNIVEIKETTIEREVIPQEKINELKSLIPILKTSNEIARGLEELEEEDKLSFNALKDVPNIKEIKDAISVLHARASGGGNLEVFNSSGNKVGSGSALQFNGSAISSITNDGHKTTVTIDGGDVSPGDNNIYIMTNIGIYPYPDIAAVPVSLYTPATEGVNTVSVSTSPTLIGNVVLTDLVGSPFPQNFITPGDITLTVNTQKSSGTDTYYIYAEIWNNSTLTLLGTTNSTTPTASNAEITNSVTWSNPDFIQVSNQYIFLKVYAVASSTVNINIRYDGDTYSRVSLQSSGSAGYVPYTGATTNVDLGVFGLTATNLYSSDGVDYTFMSVGTVESSVSVSSLLGQFTTQVTTPNLQAFTTAGLLLETANGTDIALLGVSNSANGTFYGNLNFSGTLLQPTTNDGTSLGAGANAFSDLFLAEGGVINWDNGDVTLTQVGNTLTVAGTDNFILTAGSFRPASDGAAFLGNSVVGWSALHLYSTGVINFANGNATITHSSGLLTSNVDIVVPDEAYDATAWNGNLEVPTKNAIRDKIVALEAGIGGSSIGSIKAIALGMTM